MSRRSGNAPPVQRIRPAAAAGRRSPSPQPLGSARSIASGVSHASAARPSPRSPGRARPARPSAGSAAAPGAAAHRTGGRPEPRKSLPAKPAAAAAAKPDHAPDARKRGRSSEPGAGAAPPRRPAAASHGGPARASVGAAGAPKNDKAVAALNAELASTKGDLEHTRAELDALKQQLNDTEKMLATERTRNKNNRLEIEELHERVGVAELETEMAQVDVETAVMEKEAAELELEMLKLESSSALRRAGQLEVEVAQLKERQELAAAEGSDRMVEVLQNQLRKFHDALAMAYNNYQDEKNRVHSLTLSLREQEEQVLKTKKEVERLKNMEPQLQQALEDVASLKDQLDQARDSELIMEKMSDNLQNMDGQVAALKDEAADLQAMVDLNDQINDELELINKTLRDELLRKDSVIADEQEALASVRAELFELETAVGRYKLDLREANRKLRQASLAPSALEGDDDDDAPGASGIATGASPVALHVAKFDAQSHKQLAEAFDSLLVGVDHQTDKEAIRALMVAFKIENTCAVLDEGLAQLRKRNDPRSASNVARLRELVVEVGHLGTEFKHALCTATLPQFLGMSKHFSALDTLLGKVLVLVKDLAEGGALNNRQVLTKHLHDAIATLEQLLKDHANVGMPASMRAGDNQDDLHRHARAPFMRPVWALRVVADAIACKSDTLQAHVLRARASVLALEGSKGEAHDEGEEVRRQRMLAALGSDGGRAVQQASSAVVLVDKASRSMLETATALAKQVAQARVLPTVEVIKQAQACIARLDEACRDVGDAADDVNAFVRLNWDDQAPGDGDGDGDGENALDHASRKKDEARGRDALDRLSRLEAAGLQVQEAEGMAQGVNTALTNGELADDNSAGGPWQRVGTTLRECGPVVDRLRGIKGRISQAMNWEEELRKAKEKLGQIEGERALHLQRITDAEQRAQTAEQKMQAQRAHTSSVDQARQAADGRLKDLEMANAKSQEELDRLRAEVAELEKQSAKKAKFGSLLNDMGDIEGDAAAVAQRVAEPMQEEIDGLRAALALTKQHITTVRLRSKLGGMAEFDQDSRIGKAAAATAHNAVRAAHELFNKTNKKPLQKPMLGIEEGDEDENQEKPPKDNDKQQAEGNNEEDNANANAKGDEAQQQSKDSKGTGAHVAKLRQQLQGAMFELNAIVEEMEAARARPLVFSLDNKSAQADHTARLRDLQAKAVHVRARVADLIAKLRPSLSTHKPGSQYALVATGKRSGADCVLGARVRVGAGGGEELSVRVPSAVDTVQGMCRAIAV